MHRNCLSKWFELGIQSHWFCVARYLWALLLCCRIVKSRANSSLLSSPALYSKSRYLKGTPITFFFFRSMLAISSPLLFYINFRISLWNSKQLPPPQKKKPKRFGEFFLIALNLWISVGRWGKLSWHFYMILASYSWAWIVFRFILVFFNLSVEFYNFMHTSL